MTQLFRRLDTPLGEMLMTSDGVALTGLWFTDQKHFPAGALMPFREGEAEAFREAEAWLSRYFRALDPGPAPKLAPAGTAFQLRVWAELSGIPYGQTCSYGDLAGRLAASGCPCSPRAVGGAVGRNPISLLLPCHRVLAADGSLRGYDGGLWRKAALLALEQGIPFA